MADFTTEQKFDTKEPVLEVDPGLDVGTYRFQLVVVNKSGKLSEPAEIEVTIYSA